MSRQHPQKGKELAMNRATHLSLVAAALTLIITAALAQQFGPGTFDLSWNTTDGGGGRSSGPGFELSGTIGQPDAGDALSGGAITLIGGFWPGSGPLPDTCPPDIVPFPNGDGLVNVDDLLAVINGWGSCPAPPSACFADIAPVGGNGLVNVDDLLAVINGWGTCP
jgi:hypothetical protein